MKGLVEASAGMPLKDAVQINVTWTVTAAEFRDGGGGVRNPAPGKVVADLGAIPVGRIMPARSGQPEGPEPGGVEV